MRRLLTSFIVLATMLMTSVEVKAWDAVAFRSTLDGNWDANTTIGTMKKKTTTTSTLTSKPVKKLRSPFMSQTVSNGSRPTTVTALSPLTTLKFGETQATRLQTLASSSCQRQA